MRATRHILVSVAAAVVLALRPVEAHAQFAVIDFANLAQNVQQALQTITMVGLEERQLVEEIITAVNTGKQYTQMLNDYQLQVSSLRGMSTSQIISLAKAMGGEAAIYADLADRLSRTDRNLRVVLDIYRDIERVGNYTSMTPDQIFWWERYRRQQENSYTRDRFTNIQRTLSNVQGDIQKISQLAFSIPDGGADGERSLRKGVEVVAAHLNVIAGQNTQLLGLFAEESAARSASSVSQRAITEARELNEYQKQQLEQVRIRERYRAATEAARQRWNSIPINP